MPKVNAAVSRRANGWDERDYKLWSGIQQLPHYGLIAPNDRAISRDAVIELLKKHAEERFNEAWEARCQTKK